jgi:hypothetical protein
VKQKLMGVLPLPVTQGAPTARIFAMTVTRHIDPAGGHGLNDETLSVYRPGKTAKPEASYFLDVLMQGKAS